MPQLRTTARTRFELRVTGAELAELFRVAADLGLTASAFVRLAINTAVAEYREGVALFDRRHYTRPVDHERRRSDGRRSYDRRAAIVRTAVDGAATLLADSQRSNAAGGPE